MTGADQANREDEWTRLRIERRMAEAGFARESQVRVVVYKGSVLLLAEPRNLSEFDAMLGVLGYVSGIEDLSFEVTVAEPVFVATGAGRAERVDP